MVRRGVVASILIACVCAAVFAFGYPMYVIRPFRSQGPSELQLALAVRSWAPSIATVAAMVAILAVIAAWRATLRTTPRVLCVTAAAITACFAALTYVNVYERMFHRIDSPGAISVTEAKLDADDMVLAVVRNGHARAYPIRMMGYHHIANDWVGGEPIVSTY